MSTPPSDGRLSDVRGGISFEHYGATGFPSGTVSGHQRHGERHHNGCTETPTPPGRRQITSVGAIPQSKGATREKDDASQQQPAAPEEVAEPPTPDDQVVMARYARTIH